MGRKIRDFLRWMVEPRHLLTPIATSNVLHTVEHLPEGRGAIVRGSTHVYVFGIRVANFQRTTPWQRPAE